MKPKVLVVDDEPAVADAIVYALRTDGCEPTWVSTGADALAALAERHVDLVVLDVGLPDANGFDLCREIRRLRDVPIIFLTARSAETDRVVGLEIGADDYIVKPFSPRELTARVRAVLRRTLAGAAATTTVPSVVPNAATPASGKTIGPFALDETRCEIRYHEAALALTRREYRLLLALLEQPGRVFTRDQLLTRAWDEPEASLDRTVDAHVKTLRAKLRAAHAEQDPIRTHRGFGYSLHLE